MNLIRTSARTFNRVQTRFASSTAKPDAILGLYIKEIKNYKPAPVKESEVGQVKEFKLPVAPEAPKFDGDVQAEVSAYESQ
jgi:hypothetical protein